MLRSDQIELNLEERKSRGKPWSSYHTIDRFPDIITFPESENDVSEIMKICYKYKIPIIPFGGGTSLEGQTLALAGIYLLSFHNFCYFCITILYI